MSTYPVPTITDDLVAELEAAAIEAETQGLWRLVSDDMGNEIDSDEGPVIEHTSFAQDTDMAFIAAANPATIKALLAERAELKRDAERLAAVIKDVHWRVDDTTEQLQATGHDGDRRYGLDEWSGPIKNLKMAIEILAKAMQEQPS